MIDYGLLLKDVRRDVLAWPGGRSIREDYEPDAFAPSTLAVVAEWLAGVPRAQELIALAETAQWSRAAADELIDLVDDWRQANASAISAAHESHARRSGVQGAQDEVKRAKAAHDKERNQKAAASRLERQRTKGELPVLQHRVKVAENTLGIQFDPNDRAQMKMCMDFFARKGWASHRPDYVKGAIKTLRAKGL